MKSEENYDQYSFVAEFYDHVVLYRERQDVGFFIQTALQAQGPVLEAGCGTGRILIPLARAGVEVTGIDISQTMLTACRARLTHEAPEIQRRAQVFAADMRDFALHRQFHLVLLPFRSFQHVLTVSDQISSLQTLHRHLVPGGGLVLDAFNPSLPSLIEKKLEQESEPEPEFTMPDGRRVMRRFRVTSRDLAHQTQNVEIIYYVSHPGGRQERLVHAFSMRYFFRFELEHLLTRCGFAVDALYGDYDQTPFGTKYPGELIFVAHKRA